MSSYTLRDVERLLGLSRPVVQGFVDAGFVAPVRGERNELRFSFQDLILLRTARGLVNAKIPARRISQSLARLRETLPEALPLSGIRITAVGTRVVVQQGSRQWQVDSGQYLLDLEEDRAPGEVALLPPEPAAPADDAQSLFRRAGALEAADAEAAAAAYRGAIERDRRFLAAYVNLGCLLQARGDVAAAEKVYREAIAEFPDEPLLHFNLGTALEDLRRSGEATRAYEASLALDAEFADAHYNLARLYESRGQTRDAIRHLAGYRRLTRR
jgi:tetratricopeptide (TPR) repeat protein